MNCAFSISKFLFSYIVSPAITIVLTSLLAVTLLYSTNTILAFLGMVIIIALILFPLWQLSRLLKLSLSESFMIALASNGFLLYIAFVSHFSLIYSALLLIISLIPAFKIIGDGVSKLLQKLFTFVGKHQGYIRDRRVEAHTIEEIDEMDGEAFEHYIANLLARLNFKSIKVTAYSQDNGLDISAKFEGLHYGFQCKRWKKNIPLSAIQEIYTAKELYQLDRAVVITNSGFTRAAIDAAIKLDVILIDRKRLQAMIYEIQ